MLLILLRAPQHVKRGTAAEGKHSTRLRTATARQAPNAQCTRQNQSSWQNYQPRTLAKMSGATMVASDSIMYFGVSTLSLPQVIFSLGTAPEYDPKLVVESLIWQK